MFLLLPLLLLLAGCAPAPKAGPVYFEVEKATAGTIWIEGKLPAAKVISRDADPPCAKLRRGGKITEETGVGNAFGCWFGPRVVGIRTGQPFRVTNSDPVTHNIHPRAVRNRDWNQSQAPEDPPLSRKFAVPEIMIPVKCNVHNWMRAWIGVVDHPYFAVTGADGGFVFRDVPPGTYTVAVWQESLGTQEQTAAPGSELTFTFKGN